jgi:transglutaminase-like putative cysteine protease
VTGTPTQRPATDDPIGLRVAVLVALCSAGVAAVRETGGGRAGLLVTLVGLPVASLIAHRRRDQPNRILRLALALVGLASVAWWLVRAAATTQAGIGAVQVSLAELFLWLQVLHTLDQPTRRGLRLSLLSSLVLLLIAAALSVSLDLAPFLLIWAGAATTALRLAHHADVDDHRARPSAASRPTQPGRRTVRPRVGPVLAGTAAGALLAAGLFLVAPVAGTDRVLAFPAELRERRPVPVLGGLSNPTLGAGDPGFAARGSGGGGRKRFGYFGFSRVLDTATRGRPDNTLVMRVRASAPDYWRGQTFDAWDGRRWTISREESRPIGGSRPIAVPRPRYSGLEGVLVPTSDLVQTFILERPGPNVVFGAAEIATLYFPDRTVFQLDDGTLRAAVELDDGAVYTVVSERRMVTEARLRAARSDPTTVPDHIRARYAAPPVITPRVAALARRVTAGAATWYDAVLALERHLARTTRYSLRIPPLPPGQDAVDQYLFVDRRGFCEQIGTALVVMLRSLGIPARLVVGYVPGERNPFTGLYEVRARDAHAWAEVYFPGIGWQGFDPTASVPLAGDSGLRSASAGLLSYLQARLALSRLLPGLLLALAAGGLAVTGRWVRRRRRRPPLSPLDAALARRFRRRRPTETLPAYAEAFAAVAPERAAPARVAADLCDRAAFRTGGLTDSERAALVGALAELRARR